MRGKKILVIVIVLTVVLAVLVLLIRRRSEQSIATSVASAPDGTFLVQVERPLLAGRAPWEIPRAIFGDGDPEHRFGDASPGAKVVSVAPTHLELSADGGWDLVIESDGQGHILAGTRLLFTLKLFDRQLKLNCRPADAPVGTFDTLSRYDSGKVDGNFMLKLSECKNAVSGKNTAGLPVFTLRGSFKGLPRTTMSIPLGEG